MTVRLVGLMCVVLLLSLAAFGLAMSHSQEQIMAEVARTASDVGRAAFTFNLADPEPRHVARTLSWSSEEPAGAPGTPHERARRVWVAKGDAEDAGEFSHRFEFSTPEGRERFVLMRGFGSLERLPPGGRCPEGSSEPCDMRFSAGSVFVDVHEIRTEADAQGMALVIPTLRARMRKAVDAGHGADPRPSDGMAPLDQPSDDDVLLAEQDEIHLPIDVAQFTKTFDRVRRRSLMLFLGVFVVGTVLSTGLASRFTRPVRRLDAGIRRLSDGDLGVQVEVEGKDEIGRLSRAFNEMAGRLRANRERERDMVRREKLSALGRLAAGVAHDVRNPLHSIGLTLQHLSETARPETEARAIEFERSIDIIRGEIRRLDGLVGNFLRFAKSERRDRERVDLGELLGETNRLVQKEAERRGIELHVEVDGATPPVPADAEALRSSVLNLVLNSFEAMPDGGRLTLDLSYDREHAVLEVHDTGHGISDEDREHVFDFAYTTRDGGNGLGLAMVHHTVVEEHGGHVDLESRPGEGTRVVLRLPIAPDAAAAVAREGETS